MGSSQSVHMANASKKKIWVFIGLDPMWILAELPEALVTLADLFQLMKIVVGLIGWGYTVSERPADAGH